MSPVCFQIRFLHTLTLGRALFWHMGMGILWDSGVIPPGQSPGVPEMGDFMKTMLEGVEMPKPRVWELLSNKEERTWALPSAVRKSTDSRDMGRPYDVINH